MKLTFLSLLVSSAIFCQAQQKHTVITANSKNAKIIEEDAPTSNWNLNPKIKPDIYTTSKLVKAKKIVFKTDIDSITVRLKAGEKKDFIVLLNGKDSCLTRITSPELKDYSNTKPAIHDSISFTMNNYSNMYVKGVFNQTDTLNLNFDSGSTELVLTEATLKKIKLKVKLYNTRYTARIGERDYSANVFPAELTGHETDGRFGWDLFDGLVVELNYDQNLMVVHSALPKYVKSDKDFTRLNIKYFSSIFMIQATLEQSGVSNEDWFLFDSGYQRTAMLDNDRLKESEFPVSKMEEIKRVMMHGAKGNEVPVVTSGLQELKIGKYKLTDVPVQVLTGNKPVRGANIHILGNEVLKRFNTFLDFQKNVVYLKPNHLFDAEYAEKKS